MWELPSPASGGKLNSALWEVSDGRSMLMKSSSWTSSGEHCQIPAVLYSSSGLSMPGGRRRREENDGGRKQLERRTEEVVLKHWWCLQDPNPALSLRFKDLHCQDLDQISYPKPWAPTHVLVPPVPSHPGHSHLHRLAMCPSGRRAVRRWLKQGDPSIDIGAKKELLGIQHNWFFLQQVSGV